MRRSSEFRALPKEFVDWQVALRRHTAEERRGAPHVGVAPLVTARRPGVDVGVVSHSVICGLLPRPDLLEEKTRDFRGMYEGQIAEGAKAVYDTGLEYLKGYYTSSDDFDTESVTTLLPDDLPLIDALRADPRCALVFHVFDMEDRSEVGRLRCLQLNAVAEVLSEGPVYDNVWWHNALFHGFADGCVVVHFRHQSTFDTRFGMLETIGG